MVTGSLFGRRFGAVLFDMDGTLIDSTPVVARAWATWFATEGVDPIDLAAVHGRPAAEVIEQLLPPHRRARALARLVELETNDTVGVCLLPGARQALAAVGDRGAIVTSSPEPLMRVRLAAAGIQPPAVVVTSDDVDHGKPHPEPFLRAAELLDVPPSACLVVEDAPSGLIAAQAAGMSTLAVRTANSASALPADHEVRSLADIRFVRSDCGIDVITPNDGTHY